jgi:GTP cyclohydrolase I
VRDIQGESDSRGIELERVGIAGLRYPVYFDDGQLRQSGIADTAVTVRLQHDRRGTHMSRMVALVHKNLHHFDPQEIPHVLKTGAYELNAPSITFTVNLPVSAPVVAPASGVVSWAVHDVIIEGCLDEGEVRVVTSVTSEVTSLCPCSKEISDYGAHNQRSRVTLSTTGKGSTPYPLTVTEAIQIIADSSSAPIVPLVKRPDERVLTMQAYDHPVFVEDMARDISSTCRSRGLTHEVHVRNLESIHSHDAVAFVAG